MFAVTLAADPASPRAVRAQLSRWLNGAHWPDDELDAIVYAVSEAVSNSVEHAYPPSAPGEVTITAELDLHTSDSMPGSDGRTRQVRVTIADQGTWRVPPPALEGRRRGLQLIEALMDSVTIHHPLPAAGDATRSTNTSAATRNGNVVRLDSGDRNNCVNGAVGIGSKGLVQRGTTVVLISARVPLTGSWAARLGDGPPG